MTENESWRRLLPTNGGIGVCPQIGRVVIPPTCVRQTLHLTGNRRIKAVRAYWIEGKLARFVSLLPATKGIRDMLDSLKGGETVEFMGTPREWHDMNGEVCYAVVVKDLRIIPAVKPAYR